MPFEIKRNVEPPVSRGKYAEIHEALAELPPGEWMSIKCTDGNNVELARVSIAQFLSRRNISFETRKDRDVLYVQIKGRES